MSTQHNDLVICGGKIIFQEIMDPVPAWNEYSRWISTGHNEGAPPVYSIQRFNYRTGRCMATHTKSAPYYKLYHYGFSVSGRNTNEEGDFDTFNAAAARADKHHREL